MRERPAFRVLPREPDRDPFAEKRCERERLCLTPIDPTLLENRPPPFELLRELRVHGKAGGNRQELLVELDQATGGYRGDDCRARVADGRALRRRFLGRKRGLEPIVRLA